MNYLFLYSVGGAEPGIVGADGAAYRKGERQPLLLSPSRNHMNQSGIMRSQDEKKDAGCSCSAT